MVELGWSAFEVGGVSDRSGPAQVGHDFNILGGDESDMERNRLVAQIVMPKLLSDFQMIYPQPFV